MKKLLLAILLTGFLIPSSYSQFTKIGASLGADYRYYYNDESNEIDGPSHKLKNPILSFNAIYEANLPFHIVPKLSIYFPNIDKNNEIPTFPTKTSTWAFSLDVDGHFVFNSLDEFEIYGLTGINILYVRRKFIAEENGEDFESPPESQSALGFNFGAGAYWKVKDEFDIFFEGKAVLFKHPASGVKVRGTVNVGILLNMEYLWSKEKESGY